MKTYDEITQNYKALNSNTDVKYETILSSFDKKITLLNWLNKIDTKLVNIENDVTTLSNSFGTLNDQVSENTINITELTSNFNNLNGQVSNLETTNRETFEITLTLTGAWGAQSVTAIDAATPLTLQFTFRAKKTIVEIDNLFAPFADITDRSLEVDEFNKRLINFLNEFIQPTGAQIPLHGFMNMFSGSTKSKRTGPLLAMTNLNTATDLVILIYYNYINDTTYHGNQTSITLSMNKTTLEVKNSFKSFESLYFSIHIENLDKSKILFNRARL